MAILIPALTSPWGLAAILFLALAAAATWLLKSQVRAFSALSSLAVAVLLGAVAIQQALPEPDIGTDIFGGLETDVPEDDRELAERLLVRGGSELAGGEAREARQTYERARSLYRQMGDILGEGRVALALAQLEAAVGQPDTARANISEAVGLFRQGGSALWLAQALAVWGDLEAAEGSPGEATALYAQARTEWARAPRDKASAHPVLQMDGAAALPAGDGRAVLDEARRIFTALGDRAAVADSSVVYGDLERRAENWTAAYGHYADAHAAYLEAGLPSRAADSLLRVAATDIDRGLNLEVAKSLDAAAPLYQQAADESGQARLRIVRGDVARLVGDFAAAETEYAAAESALQALDDRDQALAALRLGQAQAAAGSGEAEPSLRRAITVYRRYNNRPGEAEARLALGALLRGSGFFSDAEPALDRAVSLYRREGDAARHLRALLERAQIDGAVGRIAGAEELIAIVLPLLADAAPGIGQIELELLRGQLVRRENAAAAARIGANAADLLAALESPLAAMNAYLGLPPLDRLDVASGDPAERQANLDAHPGYLAEGRAALADLAARIDAARTVAR